jgi:hypothetical protein
MNIQLLDQNSQLGGVGANNVLSRGAQSGRGLPCEKYLNLEKSRRKETYDTRKTIDPM